MKFSLCMLLLIFFTIGVIQSFKVDLTSIRTTRIPSIIHSEPSILKLIQNESLTLSYNLTNTQFLGPSYLNNPNTLNLTFDSLRVKPYEGGQKYGTNWRVNKTLSYRINYVGTQYTYNSDCQQTRLSPNNNEIMVYNGSVKLKIEFRWSKNSTQSSSTQGRCQAQTTSSEISHIIQLLPDPENPGFIVNNVTEFYPIKFRNFVLTYIDQNATQEDRNYITSLLNNVDTTDTVKELIEADVNSKYPLYVQYYSNYGYRPRQIFYAQYMGPCDPEIILRFNATPTFFNFTKEGIYYGYKLVNQFDPGFVYNLIQPEKLDPLIYGQRQEFISFSHYRNFLWHAIKKNVTDAWLTQESSSTLGFRFYMGELFDVFSGLDTKFTPDKLIYAKCKGLLEDSSPKYKINVTQATNASFFVEMGWSCYVQAQAQYGQQPIKVVKFNLTAKIQVTGFPKQRGIDFWANKFTLKNLEIDDSLEYKLLNRKRVEEIVNQVRKTLYNHKMIGSGWAIMGIFKKPQFVVTKTGTFVTDLSYKSN